MGNRQFAAVAVVLCVLVGSSFGALVGYTTNSVVNHYTTLTEMADASNDLIGDGHTLLAVNDLAGGDLSGLDVLVVGVVQDVFVLGASDLDAIEAFVLGGGNMVFLGENNTYFHSNNVAVGGLFGISYPALDPAEVMVSTVPLPRHPIMDGPYGVVNQTDGSSNNPGYYGSMSDAGPYGSSILDFPGGNSAAVVLEKDALAAGSGIVVAFAEVNIWTDTYYGGDNRALWRNTFAYVPEPATMVLMALGGMVLRRRK